MTGRETPGRRPRLQVAVTDGRGRPVRTGHLGPWLEGAAPRTARGTVAIALVSDPVMRRLNRDFRGKDRVTDVLSFPGPEEPQTTSRATRKYAVIKSDKSILNNHLGDIAIALGMAGRQARAHGHGLAIELRILALHGLLHLLGYDHERDRGEMQETENRLRRRHGLPEGLIGRASRRPSA